MAGIDWLLTAVCLNATYCDVPAVPVEQAPAPAPDDLTVIYPVSTSADEKEHEMQQLREELNGQDLKIAMMDDFPLSYHDENGVASGVAFQLLEFLTEKFNFTYTTVTPPKQIMGSSQDYDGSLIEMLNKSQAAMAAAFLPVMADAREFVEFSTTTLDEGNWIMMMKRPGESATGSGLLAPFDKSVWLLILLSLLTVGPAIYGLIIVRMKLTRDTEQKIYPLPHCVWFVYGALMKQGSTLSPLADSTRLLFATWWIFITILTSFYTANLTAFLTLSKFTLPYNSMEDIRDHNQKFVATRGGAVEYAIRNSNESLATLQSMVDKNRVVFADVRPDNDNETLITYVQKDSYVLIKDRPAIDHLIYADYKYRKTISNSDREHCPFAVATKPFLTKKRSFAYNKDFKFRRLFDPELLNIVESGIVKYMLLENLPSATICPQNLGSSERQLRNGDLMMTYQIMMAGFATGAVIFVTEIFFKYLLNRHHKLDVREFQRSDGNGAVRGAGFKAVTPPPSYGTLYNPPGDNVWTTGRLKAAEGGGVLLGTSRATLEHGSGLSMGGVGEVGAGGAVVHRYINGRQYRVQRDRNGGEQLVPMGTPSATLFQYQYTN